jgi:hypothetical protein
MAVRMSALRAVRSLTSRKIPGTHFCYRLSRHQGHNAAGSITLIEESNDLIGIIILNFIMGSVTHSGSDLPSFILTVHISKGSTFLNYKIPSSGKQSSHSQWLDLPACWFLKRIKFIIILTNINIARQRFEKRIPATMNRSGIVHW